jgi:hypothetical protein
LGAGLTASAVPLDAALLAQQPETPGFKFVDVTSAAGLAFRHNSGAYGGKLLPETLGSGCAFLDYDADGWQDILLVNGMDWPGHKRQRSTLRLYRNNRNGTFTDVTRAAGLDVELYGMGVAVGDVNNDGFPDILVTCVGQNRLFRNSGKGTFVDATGSSISSSVTTSGGRPITTSSAVPTASRRRTARRRRTAERPAGCSGTRATAPSRTSPRRAGSSIRAPSRSASRSSITIRTAGPISSSPTTRSPTSCIATSGMARSRTWRSRPASP